MRSFVGYAQGCRVRTPSHIAHSVRYLTGLAPTNANESVSALPPTLPASTVHDSGKVPRSTRGQPALGATTSTVPWAAQTVRPSFSTSMRTTAVRLVSEMIRARASSAPTVTAAR
jgi:hypothetical protein